MSLSSFCVVTNALRLNWCKLDHDHRDKKVKSSIRNSKEDIVTGDQTVAAVLEERVSDKKVYDDKKETGKMEKKMVISGMMCGHCEATVKKALEGLDGVTQAIVSHEQGTAIVELSKDVSDEVLKKAVEDKDYTVVSVNH